MEQNIHEKGVRSTGRVIVTEYRVKKNNTTYTLSTVPETKKGKGPTAGTSTDC